jgi:hypothetical protein
MSLLKWLIAYMALAARWGGGNGMGTTPSFDNIAMDSPFRLVHGSVANSTYPCGLPGCSRRFLKYAAFRSHIYIGIIEAVYQQGLMS